MNTALINKKTLSLIIKATKVSYSYLEKENKQAKEKIMLWADINSKVYPTIIQAKKLANTLHVPFAGLYLKGKYLPTKKIPNLKNFRTLKEKVDFDDSYLNLALIDLLNKRELLIDTMKELKVAIVSFDLKINSEDIKFWAKEIRRIFNLDIIKQYKTPSTRQFYLYVREQIEKQNIMVSCFSKVPFEVARGLSIYNKVFPIIGVNDNDRYPAKTFTIIHELVHILKNNSTKCNDFYSVYQKEKEEVFCNAIAGEVLAPEKELRIELSMFTDKNISYELIVNLANKFSVSKEVIARRLYDLDYIEKDEYNRLIDDLKEKIELEKKEIKEHRNGSRYFTDVVMNTIDYNSSKLSNVFLKGISAEIFDKQDISRYLGISYKYVDKYLNKVALWNR